MRNLWTMQRRWWLVASLISILVLAACVAQIPAVTPDAPVEDAATDAPAAEDGDAENTEAEETDSESNDAGATDEEAAASEGDAGEEAVAAALALMGGAAIPSDETYKGLPVGFTEDGRPYRGDPDAPIVMIEYSDLQCPFCNRHFVQTEPAVDESYVRTGQVRVVFHDFPLVSLHPNAPAAHEASLCVADQGSAASYWNYHAELFRSVDEWQAVADPLPILARIAEEMGVDADAYASCMEAGTNQALVQQRVEAAFAVGFSATPSFQIVRVEDGAIFPLIGAQPYEQFAAVVDAALAGESPVAEAPAQQQQQQQPSGIPFWATAAGWQPNPDRPGYNMAGDQYRGSLDAPLTVIEFSDFQCPFCQRHNSDTQPALDEKYVETGKVLWIYKHFPLNIHPQAPAAGIAAECAAEQGQFWEMNEALFASVQEWSVNEPNPVFEGLAADLGLDGDAFATCLLDPAMAERVDSDLAEGTQFVEGTPTFIIVHGDQGSIIPGALPEASFSQLLDEELAAVGVTE